MADQGTSTVPVARAVAFRVAIGLLITLGFVVLLLGGRGMAAIALMLDRSHPHAPDWRQIAEAPLVIQVHLATVVVAVLLATVQVIGPKGRTFHRTLGWILTGLFLITAITALFIRNPQGGLFNPFQVFSIWTLVCVPWAIIAARRHNVRRHGSLMYGFYFGGMLLAGALAFLPGRLMWRVFFG